MYQALYRAYRPEVFDDVLGQEHIVRILKNQIANGSSGHAYLFCGTRGTGKTTTARLLAKGLNCLSEGDKPCGTCPNCMAIKDGSFMDVIEIDAASNRNIDDIRELRETINYPPVIGRKKVYIIDEVHMLTLQAANALLKTLEEPPEDVVFILCTTDPQKLPATILSRCIRFDFRRVSENVLTYGMDRICKDKGIDVEEDALRLIAANGDGSVRDSLSILDQCIAIGQSKITRQDVLDLIGISGYEVFLEMTDHVASGKTDEALLLLSDVLMDGKDVKQFMKDWMSHYRSLLITKYVKNPEDILNVSRENVVRFREQAERLDTAEIHEAILELAHMLQDAKYSNQPRVLLEISIVKLSDRNFGKAFARPVQTAPAAQATVQAPVQTQAPSKAQASAPAETPAPETPARDFNIPQGPIEMPVFEPEPEDAPTMDAQASANQAPAQTQAAPQAQAPVETAPAAPSFTQEDLERLWQRVFEEGESRSTTFNLLRGNTKLTDIGDESIIVEANSDLRKNFVNTNADEISRIIENITGRKLSVLCYVTGSEKPAIRKSAAPAAAPKAPAPENMDDGSGRFDAALEAASSLLGIKIDITD